jgi:hypothetical protein
MRTKTVSKAAGTAHSAAIPQHHLAIIAAAVAAFCGENARILAIHSDHAAENPWGRSGRVGIHGSHNPRVNEGIERLLTKQNPGVTKK